MKKIHVIINPASGKDEPILNTLNRVFREHDVQWDVDITHGPGDAQRLAQEAAASGVDLVAGYGGDGALMEIANGLQGSDVPLGILPGGTGNSVARELGIPVDLAQAAELLCKAPRTPRAHVRAIDLGRVGDRYFALHVYTGMRPSQRADRDSKDSLGLLAYVLSALRVLRDPQETRYRLSVDGEEMEHEGIVCFILNVLSVQIEWSFAKTIGPDDGLLDLILVKEATLAALPALLEQKNIEEYLQHWQGREISVHPDLEQDVWLDGEASGKTPVTAVAVPKALRVIVPERAEARG